MDGTCRPGPGDLCVGLAATRRSHPSRSRISSAKDRPTSWRGRPVLGERWRAPAEAQNAGRRDGTRTGSRLTRDALIRPDLASVDVRAHADER